MKIRSSLLHRVALVPACGVLLPALAVAETPLEPTRPVTEPTTLTQPSPTLKTQRLAQVSPATSAESASSSGGASTLSSGASAPQAGAAGASGASGATGVSSGAQPKPSGGTAEAPITYGSRKKLMLQDDDAPADPKAYTLTLSGGPAFFDGTLDTSTCGVVGKLSPSSPGFRAQFGRTWFSQLQLQLDVGVSKDAFYACAASDVETTGSDTTDEEEESSGEVVDLSLFDLSLGLAYRLDYFDEQPLVPYLTAGLSGDLIALTDTAYVDETLTETALGHRLGVYAGGGLEVLLDTFGPARAADLELSSGINDSYFVLDARYVWKDRYLESGAMNTTSVLAFYGWQVTGGLKFDF
ncbi:MAG: hypothetical protein ACKO6N_22050 [Myxococcota bacterium]